MIDRKSHGFLVELTENHFNTEHYRPYKCGLFKHFLQALVNNDNTQHYI